MRRAGIWRYALILLALLATSCGSLVAPFESAPQLADDGTDIGDRVGVCYNKMFSTPEQVRAVAVEACGPNTTPQLVNQDMHLTCPLLTPVRASFQCAPE